MGLAMAFIRHLIELSGELVQLVGYCFVDNPLYSVTLGIVRTNRF